MTRLSVTRSGIGCVDGIAGESSPDGRDLKGTRDMQALPFPGQMSCPYAPMDFLTLLRKQTE